MGKARSPYQQNLIKAGKTLGLLFQDGLNTLSKDNYCFDVEWGEANQHSYLVEGIVSTDSERDAYRQLLLDILVFEDPHAWYSNDRPEIIREVDRVASWFVDEKDPEVLQQAGETKGPEKR